METPKKNKKRNYFSEQKKPLKSYGVTEMQKIIESSREKKKKAYTFKLDPDLIDKLKKLSEKDNRPFNNYVETVLIEHAKKHNH